MTVWELAALSLLWAAAFILGVVIYRLRRQAKQLFGAQRDTETRLSHVEASVATIVSALDAAADGQTDSKLWHWEKPKNSLDDVHGIHAEVRAEISTLIRALSNKLAMAAVGAVQPSGILLAGPTGVDNDMIANAVADGLARQFCGVDASLLPSKYVNASVERIRELFNDAVEHAPCVLFLDHLEVVGTRLSGNKMDAAEILHQNTMLQLIACMKALDDQEVLVIASTERAEVLDPALLRAGVFERTVFVDLPDANGREAVLRDFARRRKMRFAPNVRLDHVARTADADGGTLGFAPADLRNMLQRAALNTAAEGSDVIDGSQVAMAIRDVKATVTRRTINEVMGEGRARMRVYDGTGPAVTFDDVGGHTEAKERLRDVIGYLADPAKYVDVNPKYLRSLLLAGPPGVGKTLLARAVAHIAKVPFLFCSGADFIEQYVGVGAARVRDLFRIARRHGRCVVFVDELDAVGIRRDAGHSGGHEEHSRTLNMLLTEIDGFAQDAEFVVIAATNVPEVLDPALVRPGRFLPIRLDLPDPTDRRRILDIYLRDGELTDGDRQHIVKTSHGRTGADLEQLINEARLSAIRRSVPMDRNDIETARTRIDAHRRDGPPWWQPA